MRALTREGETDMRSVVVCAAVVVGVGSASGAEAQSNLWNDPQLDREIQRRQLERINIERQAAEERRNDERMRMEYGRAMQERRLLEQQNDLVREEMCVRRGGNWTYGSCIPRAF